MGTVERRQREAQRRRQDILAAARKLFWDQGYFRTTVPQIAQAAELAPGTLYLYFSGKGEMYAALLEEGYEILRQQLEQKASSRPRSPQGRAEAMIDAFFKFAADYPEYFNIIYFVFQRDQAGWEDSLPEEAVQRLQARESACKDLAGRVLEDADDVPANERAALVDAVWSMLAGVVFFFKEKKEFASIAREAKRLILAAVFMPRT